MTEPRTVLITGTRKGIGKYLAEYYSHKGFQIIGCSRKPVAFELSNYKHYCLDVSDESSVIKMFDDIRTTYHGLDILINNAGIGGMNHTLLTPLKQVSKIMDTNYNGTFVCSREAAKLMMKSKWGRIVNFSTVATPWKLEGEAIYASSKAAISSLTQVMARELADFGITVNAVGPTPIDTDLIRSISSDKIQSLINRQAIKRMGEFEDISNVIDFFISPTSDFITGQIIYLGGV